MSKAGYLAMTIFCISAAVYGFISSSDIFWFPVDFAFTAYFGYKFWEA